MAYSAIEKMRKKNEQIYGSDVGPMQPALSASVSTGFDLYTYSIASSTKPKLSMDMHPMAWLLLLCDELQCWDRTAYGRNSRKELHSMAVEFDFSGNRIFARYLYDEKEQDKIDKYLWAYVAWKQNGRRGVRPKLKAYSEMAKFDGVRIYQYHT